MKCKAAVVCVVLNMFWTVIRTSRANEYTGSNHEVYYKAIVNITYKDPITGDFKSEIDESGKYGESSPIEREKGIVVHVKDENGEHDGCSKPVNVPSEHWIALVKRGKCTFEEKIRKSAVISNASAVVIYNDSQKQPQVPYMKHGSDVVSIAISQENGERIALLVDNGTRVWMDITVGPKTAERFQNNINKTSVLFVSISFIVLMIISLAWLVFYYIQRFRYAHAKERLSKRLMHAARKAIAKMSSRSLKAGDKETHPDADPCAVCIENYRSGEVVRTLPCGHIFHKSCVDPWLIEQRSCPMCKSDILKAYGLQIHSSLGSLVNLDLEAASTSIGPSELLPQSSILHSEPGIVEVLYYPNITGGNHGNHRQSSPPAQEIECNLNDDHDHGNKQEEMETQVVDGVQTEDEEEMGGILPEEQQTLLGQGQGEMSVSNGDQDEDQVGEDNVKKTKKSGNNKNRENGSKEKICKDARSISPEDARNKGQKSGGDEMCVGLLSKEAERSGVDADFDDVSSRSEFVGGGKEDGGQGGDLGDGMAGALQGQGHPCTSCEDNASGAASSNRRSNTLDSTLGDDKSDSPVGGGMVKDTEEEMGGSNDPTQEARKQTVRIEGVPKDDSTL